MTAYERFDDRDRGEMLSSLDFMTKHPETGYREWKCSEYMLEAFRRYGYEPTLAGDIPGFFVKIDTGREGPCVLVFGELDAVKCSEHPEADPETEAVHACGHNAQSAALVGIAAALAKPGALDGLSGSILLCAVPAEEMIERDFRDTLIAEGKIAYYGGKPEFLRRGYFDGVDLALMVHTAGRLCVRHGSVGIVAKKIIYKGRASHAGGSPQNGINALYAATQGLAAVNAIRETFTEPDLVRVHPIITKGGTVVNGIPDVVEIESYVRAKTYEAMENANKKVNRAFVGAALSIGANVEILDAPGYAPLVNDPAMMDVAEEAAAIAYPDVEFICYDGFSTGSTDMGDISRLFPTVHPYAPGAEGSSHGANYKIADPEGAVIRCTAWQVEMLGILLGDGARRAKEIMAGFTPEFKTKEEYFDYIARFESSGDRLTYGEGSVEARL